MITKEDHQGVVRLTTRHICGGVPSIQSRALIPGKGEGTFHEGGLHGGIVGCRDSVPLGPQDVDGPPVVLCRLMCLDGVRDDL